MTGTLDFGFLVPTTGLVITIVSFFVPTTGVLIVSVFVVTVGGCSVSCVVLTSTSTGRLTTRSPFSVRPHAPRSAKRADKQQSLFFHLRSPGLEVDSL